MSIFTRLSFRKTRNADEQPNVTVSPNNQWDVQEVTEELPTPQKVKIRLNVEANELTISPDFRVSFTMRKIDLSATCGIHTMELRNRKEHKEDLWNEMNVPRAVYKHLQTTGTHPMWVLVMQTTRSCNAKDSLVGTERLYAKLGEEIHSYFRPHAHVFIASCAEMLERIRQALGDALASMDVCVLTHRLGERESLIPVSAYCERFARTEFDTALRSWLIREHTLLRLRVDYYPQYAVVRERSDEVVLIDVFCWLQLLRVGYPRVEMDAFLRSVESLTQLDRDVLVSFTIFERLYFDVLLDRVLAELRAALQKSFSADLPAEPPLTDLTSSNRWLLTTLFARSNSAMDPVRTNQVTQNMDEPLTAYWIASSHNTYLTRHQTPGHSTCDAYRHALLMGARCIEMDVYDGDESPVILHGMGIATLSNKIRLDTVLHVVKKYAFVTSDYPVIISIENHCVQQLGKMASLFRKVLADQLVDKPLTDCDKSVLPSPSQLRNRFLLKASYRRKHHAELCENTNPNIISTSGANSKLNGSQNLSFSDEDESPCRELYPSVGCAVTWGKFQLTDKRVQSTLQTCESDWLWVLDSEEHMLFFQKHDIHVHKRRSDTLVEPAGALRGYAWFHASATREDAEQLLLANRSLGNGAFLVRPCQGGRKTPFALSILFENAVLHARIEMNTRSELVDGEKVTRARFGIEGLTARFSTLSLPLLVEHYRKNRLELKLFQASLGEPVAVWLHESLSRQVTACVLQNHYADGLYLVRSSNRPSALNDSSYAAVWSISMCTNGTVQHVRVCQLSDKTCSIGSCRFASLEEVIRHYVEQPLVGGQVLVDPLTHRMLDDALASPKLRKSASLLEHQHSIEMQESGGYVMAVSPRDSSIDGTLFPYFRASRNSVRDPVRDILQHKGSSQHLLYAIDLFNCELEPLICHSETTDCRFLLREKNDSNCNKAAKRRRNSDTLFGGKRSRSRAAAESGIKITCARSDSNHDVCLLDMIRATQNASAARSSPTAPPPSTKKRDSLKVSSSAEFYELIVYCKSLGSSGSFCKNYASDRMFSMQAGYTGWSNRQTCEMPEASLHVGSASVRQVLRFTSTNLMRTYPNWRQISSGNFNPVAYWNVGTQMVALNYQTVGKPMMANAGRFIDNGGCGYVLKPQYMRRPASVVEEDLFDPNDQQRAARFCKPVTLDLTVIAAHHVCRTQPGRGLLSVFVEVDLYGVPSDCQTKRTRPVPNGFFPIWNDRLCMKVTNRDLALLLFTVYDTECLEDSDSENKAERDSKAKRTLIGYACYPVAALRDGLRSVQIHAPHGQLIAACSLLVHVLIRESSS